MPLYFVKIKASKETIIGAIVKTADKIKNNKIKSLMLRKASHCMQVVCSHICLCVLRLVKKTVNSISSKSIIDIVDFIAFFIVSLLSYNIKLYHHNY